MAREREVASANLALKDYGAQVAAAFSVDAAAKYIGISRAGMWRLLKAGELQCVRIGGRTLFRRVDLDAFLERCVERAG